MPEKYQFAVEKSDSNPKDYFLSGLTPLSEGTYWDFCLYKKEKKKAWVTFFIDKNSKQAVSLPQLPFGGIWFQEKLHSEILAYFIEESIQFLQKQGIQKIEITQPPKPYQDNHDLIDYLLFKLGFVPHSLVAHQFFIGRKRIKKFLQKEEPKFYRRVKDGKLQVYSGPIQNFEFLNAIRAWNENRGYAVSLDESKLIGQVSEFPERYFLISLEKNGKVIAHTLAVKLTENSIYYFQSAIHPNSPINHAGEILLYYLFRLADELKVELIDLGSSDQPDSPNHSLMFFKSRFSNDISNKVTWVKTL
ncbi:MAG: GNAT family N-acetyltransferase [Algoriphagus sp.]|uniref:hypothetical protein n=1 Tax=Algoriphagus sp. TaxID=1872435 RepID=UPI001791F391|nr:hypothetical protein [Algoriphagus sp.]NVJ85145.1 GNAT family N-acetyltransferase [Algoriphagus sp.]